MDSRKICILGDFAVGKTSLVKRFVHQQFAEHYLTSIGVKVDTKTLQLADGIALKLAIWDIAGTNTPTELFVRYTRGAAGYLLVADATRRETLHCCARLHAAVSARIGLLPHVLLVNKSDLAAEREVDAALGRPLLADALDWVDTSARTGAGVEQAFHCLAEGLRGPAAAAASPP